MCEIQANRAFTQGQFCMFVLASYTTSVFGLPNN